MNPTAPDKVPRALSNPSVEAPPLARRVLVIEDNVDSAQALATLLEIAGHEVRTAHEGEGALDVARSFKPNVILLDIGLPGIDGYEVGRRLQEAIGSDVVLLAMTGYAEERDRQRSKQAGFHEHLVKPVSPEVLLKLVSSTRTLGA